MDMTSAGTGLAPVQGKRRHTVGLVAALALALIAGMAPLAAADPVVSIAHAWNLPTQAPVAASVANGAASPAFVWLSTNDTTGSATLHTAPKFTVRVLNGSISSMPPECSTATSSITKQVWSNGTANVTQTLKCTLADSVSGSSVRVTVPVVANGWNGLKLQVDSWVGHGTTAPAGSPAALTRNIVASAAVDVRADHTPANTTVEYTSRVTIPVPVSISIPTGGAGLKPSASFVLTLGNMSGASVTSNLSPYSCDARGVSAMTGWPAPRSDDSTVKCAFAPYGSGGNQWTVNVTGFNVDTGNGQTIDNRGAALPTDRVHLASFNVLLRNSKTLFGATTTGSVFKFFARADSAYVTGADSVTRNDTPATNNRTEITYILGGSRAAGWTRNNPSRMSYDGRAVGGEWDNMARPMGNETWMSYVMDTTNSSAPAATGQDLSLCMVIPNRDNGTKYVGNPGWVYFNAPAGNNVTIDYLTSGVTVSAGQSWDCNTAGLTWKTAAFAPQGAAATAIANDMGADTKGDTNQWSLHHLRYMKTTGTGSLEAPTIIRMRYTAANIAANPPYEEIDGSSYLGVPADIFTNTPGERLWTFGSTRRHTDEATFYKSTQAPVVLNLGSGTPSTITGMRDVLTMGSWRVGARATSPATGRVGKNVTVALTWSNIQNTAPGSDAVNTVAILPPGLGFVSASTAPTRETPLSGDRTQLEWDLRSPAKGSSQTVTVTATALQAGELTTTLQVVKNGATAASKVQGDVATDSATTQVFDSGETVLDLTTDGTATTGTTVSGAPNTWINEVTNGDARSQTIIDTVTVLPFNGDARGTSFTGTYTVSSATANVGTIYYTSAAPAGIADDPAAASNGSLGSPSGIWSTTKPANVTAVRHIAGAVSPGASVTSTINWTANGVQEGDKLVAWSKSRATFTVLPVQRAATMDVDAAAHLQVDIIQEDKTVPLGDGDQVYYQVTVRNSGTAIAFATEVSNSRLANLDSPAWSDATQGAASGDVWTVGDLAPGQQETVRLRGNVVSGSAGQIRNAVAVNGNTCTITNPQVNVGVAADTDGCDADADTENAALKVHIAHTDKTVLKAGGTVTFTVTGHNVGPDTASDVTLETPSVDGFTMDAAAFPLGDMAPGATVTRTVTGTVKAGFDPNVQALNGQAVIHNSWKPRAIHTTTSSLIAGCVANPDVASDLDQCDFDGVEESSTIQVDKSVASFDALAPGETVLFTVEVRNTGTDPAANVSVTDTAFAGLSNVAFTEVSQGAFTGDVWTVGDVVPDATVTATVTATAGPGSDVAGVTNGAWVSSLWNPRTAPSGVSQCGANIAGVESDDDQCDWDQIAEDAYLQVDKQLADFDSLSAGSEVEFIVTTQNAGTTTAANVTVTDKAMVGLTDVVFSGPGVVTGADTSVWNVGHLPANQARSAVVTAKVAAGAVPENGLWNAAAVANAANPRTITTRGDVVANVNGLVSDDDQADEAGVTGAAVLRIHKQLTTKGVLVAGQQVTFTVSALNTGNADGRNVKVTDVPLDGFTNARFLTADRGTVSGNVWSMPTLTPNNPAMATVEATVTAAADVRNGLLNAATISAEGLPRTAPTGADDCEANPDAANDTDQCDVATVVENSQLKVEKTVIGEFGAPGGTLEWQIAVTNTGPDTATAVTVTDNTVSGLDGATIHTPTQGTVQADGAGWLVGNLAPGAMATAQVTSTVSQAMTDHAVVRNRVWVQSPANPKDPDAGCVANTGDIGTDTDQCDIGEGVVRWFGSVEVEVLFDATGTAGDCTAAGSGCAPVSNLPVVIDGARLQTSNEGLAVSGQVAAGTIPVAVTLPGWSTTTWVGVDGVAESPAAVPKSVRVDHSVRKVRVVVTVNAVPPTPPVTDVPVFESGK